MISNRLAVAIATGGYISYIPVRLLRLAPWLRRSGPRADERWTGAGFAGTLLGWAAIPLLPREPRMFVGALVAAIAAACWVSGVAERAFGQKDDSRIIIDEVVGYWTSVALLPRTTAVLFAGFILFRVLDTFKLPPYRWLERLPGGLGVVMDDVGAGVVANLALRAALGRGWL